MSARHPTGRDHASPAIGTARTKRAGEFPTTRH